MGLTEQNKYQIKELLKDCILNKLHNYSPETVNMPFHYRLLGKDRMALYSFIHSVNTIIGTSIYEQVAIAIASTKFKTAKSQYAPHYEISSEAHRLIQSIMDEIKTATRSPDKKVELEFIRSKCQVGQMDNVKLTKVDILLESYEGQLYLFDIKTVKPNRGNFIEFKRTLLEWAAAEMARNPEININTAIAIPYNPYEPKPYERWTIVGIFDMANEIYVADEFWDFLGGAGTYNDLLDCFELAGIELRPKLDDYFSKF